MRRSKDGHHAQKPRTHRPAPLDEAGRRAMEAPGYGKTNGLGPRADGLQGRGRAVGRQLRGSRPSGPREA
ncbi:hypothetical protein OCEANICA350_11446 [Oceanicaulis sp. 350]|nr:hypothetical protein OCEANICA350_11446 [Oceanicaulis sp. 350]